MKNLIAATLLSFLLCLSLAAQSRQPDRRTERFSTVQLIGSDLVPEIDDTYSLGDPLLGWRDGWFTGILYAEYITSAFDGGIFFGTGISTTGNIVPNYDNLYSLGFQVLRWADIQAVMINGQDIGFSNGWKFREYPATASDLGKTDEWFRAHANQGVQLLDEKDRPVIVFHRNGNVYLSGKILPLSELPTR